MRSIAPTFFLLQGGLSRFRRYERTFKIWWGFHLSVTMILPIWMVLLSLEALFHFSSGMRLMLFTLGMAISIAIIIVLILRPLLQILIRPDHPSLIETALKVGRYYAGVDDRLGNALQLYQKTAGNRENYSLTLIEAALAQVGADLQDVRFTDHIDRKPMRQSLMRLLGVVSVTIAIWIALPSIYGSALQRMVYPTRDGVSALQNFWQIYPGTKSILWGSDVSLRAWTSDITINEAQLHLLSEGQEKRIPLKRALNDTFRYNISGLKDSLTYFFSAGKIKSPSYRLEVLHLPMLRKFTVKLSPPSYTRIQPMFLEENLGDFNALRGTQIEFTGESNKVLDSAYVRFQGGAHLPMLLQDRTVKGSFIAKSEETYYIQLVDRQGHRSENPLMHHIKIIEDQVPLVQIVAPGKDIDLGEDMQLPLVILAQDDFGVSRLRLGFAILPEGIGETDSLKLTFQDLEGLRYGSERLDVSFFWNLNEIGMLPTDVLIYCVEAYDNDAVSGPKKGRTKLYRARFPSMYELYQEIADDQEESQQSIQNLVDEGRELQQKLQNLTLEMNRATEVDWQKRKEIEDALAKKQEMQRELREVTEKFSEMLETMERNNLASLETLNKYQELQQLLHEIMTPELQEAMKKVAETLQTLDPKAIQKALEQLKLSQADFNQRLDRTIALLKRLKAEQMLDQAQQMAKDLSKRQDQITQNSCDAQADAKKLVSEQQQINRDADTLQETLQALREMTDVPELPLKQIDSTLAAIQSERLTENLDKLVQMLESREMQMAELLSQKSQAGFQRISEQLSRAKSSMSGEMQMKAMLTLQQSARNLLELSQRQEKIFGESQEHSPNLAILPEIAERQHELDAALSRLINRLYDLAKENVFIQTELGRSMGRASNQMKEALKALESREGRVAARNQGLAMMSLNDAVKQLQESLQKMAQQGSSGGGMTWEQLMQQMQQLSQGQQGINQETLGLGGQSSPEQLAAMARMAAEQGQLRKSMEQLADEAARFSEVLGDLNQIADDMKKVERDLESQNVNRDTIERQNRILSRMLDSQRSIREREFTNQRKAETGGNYLSSSPEELPSDLGERESRLQQDLLRAKKEGFSRDYIELIKKYFDALVRQENGK